ncbi:amidohydrolase [Sporosarcina sp. NCCP-2716]|uniref:amidohydrolase n=1 Tax=Sporosarcina sp. NCCP-2716 TaxID=2943679 RepID=UPI00203B1FAD|nr:amidohydrolase [Sporosarcina sp. NCCP-2716]GKV69355.1 amidohydrolase [Sporosarcina sp. NCCP-2716]
MAVAQQIRKWFDHFHAHPEVSWKEHETTKEIARILTEMDVPFKTFEDVTGAVAEIGEGRPIAAVRADIDALWQEVDGTYQANHSCGHDGHMAMVLGALSYLKDEPLGGKIRFIFQPAEEKGNGSNAMIDRGAVDDLTYLFGIHLRPKEELPLGKASAAIRHGAAYFAEGKINGTDAHGARPHQGRNAIDPLLAIGQFLKTVQFSPYEPYSAKLTRIEAGGESLNIIPGTAKFGMDVRAQTNDVLQQLKQRIDKGIQDIAELYGTPIDVTWTDHTPAAEVSAEAADIAREAIIDVLGEDGYAPDVITSGSDDFHFYTIRNPDLKATMIGLGADLGPGLHHPAMTFDRDSLVTGAKILAETLKRASHSVASSN